MATHRMRLCIISIFAFIIHILLLNRCKSNSSIAKERTHEEKVLLCQSLVRMHLCRKAYKKLRMFSCDAFSERRRNSPSYFNAVPTHEHRSRVLEEIVNTERNYLKSLQTLISVCSSEHLSFHFHLLSLALRYFQYRGADCTLDLPTTAQRGRNFASKERH